MFLYYPSYDANAVTEGRVAVSRCYDARVRDSHTSCLIDDPTRDGGVLYMADLDVGTCSFTPSAKGKKRSYTL